MYIGSIMRTDLITVAPKTTLVEAKEPWMQLTF